MGLGILDLVELAVVVGLAIPIALLGVQFLVEGDALLGGGFLGLGVAMVLVKFYLPSPTDVPKEMAQESAKVIAKDESEREE